jgi:hypothetical protein
MSLTHHAPSSHLPCTFTRPFPLLFVLRRNVSEHRARVQDVVVCWSPWPFHSGEGAAAHFSARPTKHGWVRGKRADGSVCELTDAEAQVLSMAQPTAEMIWEAKKKQTQGDYHESMDTGLSSALSLLCGNFTLGIVTSSLATMRVITRPASTAKAIKRSPSSR